VGYLRMFYFSAETTRAMLQALSSWGVAGLQGYIIDLRNNPGSPLQVEHLRTSACVSGGPRMGPPLFPVCSIQPLSRPAQANSPAIMLQLPASQQPAATIVSRLFPSM
jgi:hypothetical protein